MGPGEPAAMSWHALRAATLATPRDRVALAVVLTAVDYSLLAGYDLLAFAAIGKSLPRRWIAAVSFVACAISNNVGFPMVSGTSVRYRFYTRWGVTITELSRVVLSYMVTFWLGLLTLGGVSLALSRTPLAWILVALPIVYIIAAATRSKPLRIWRYELPLPPPDLATSQLLLSLLDWTVAGAVLYVLLPRSDLSFPTFLGSFLVANLAGLVSHVPGGVGVFDGLMILMLESYIEPVDLVPALIVFRATYYLLPLSVALAGMAIDETWRRLRVGRATSTGGCQE